MKNVYRLFICMAIIMCFSSLGYAQCSCSIDGGTDISGPLTEDTVWEKSNSPYCITDNITVFQGKTLTIEPSVVVKFCPTSEATNKYSIVINGQLIAKGSASEPIVITSAAGTPQPGDWAYIELTDQAIPALFNTDGTYKEGSILEYVTIEYAGSATTDGSTYKRAFHAAKAPYFNHVIIRNNNRGGLYIGTSTTVTNSEFYNNNTSDSENHGAAISTGIADVTLTVTNSTFSENHAGHNCAGGAIRIESSLLTVKNCTFSNNTSDDGGAIMSKAVLYISDSEFTNNSAIINGGAISYDEYYWDDDLTVVNCKFTNNTAERTGGAISANYGLIKNSVFTGNSVSMERDFDSNSGGAVSLNIGTVNKCIFNNNTAYNIKYPSYGGALVGGDFLTVTKSIFVNNKADNESGGWCSGGAIFGDLYSGDARTTVNDSFFIYNNSPGTDNTLQGFVLDIDGTLNLNNCLVYGSEGLAIQLKYGDIENTTIAGHKRGGIHIIEDGNPVINSSNLHNNNIEPQTYELRNHSSKPITATGNYWGTADTQVILEKIYDYYDDNQIGEVNFGISDNSFLTDFNTYAPAIPDKIVVSPSSNDFDKLNINTSEYQTFATVNAGDGDLAISEMTIKGTDSSEFSFSENTCVNKTLASHEMCTFNVAYSRSELGEKNATVEIKSDDGKNPAMLIPLMGLTLSGLPGDVNNDGQADLTDLILVLKNLAGYPVDPAIFLEVDVNGDKVIGLEEAIYILRSISG